MTFLPNQLELQTLFSGFLFEAGLSNVSVKNYLSDLRHFFSFCASISPVIPGTDPESMPTVQEIFQNISKYLPLYLTEQKKNFTPQNTTNRRSASIRRFSTFLSSKFGLTSSPEEPLHTSKNTLPSINSSHKSEDASLPTVGKILDHFKHFLEKEKKTNSTVKNYVSDLNHFFAWSASSTPFMDQDLENLLSESQLNAYVTYLKLSHTGTSVIARRQSSIRQFTKYCFLQKYIPSNPFEYKRETPRLAPLSWFERFSTINKNKSAKNGPKSRLATWYQKYNSLPFTPYLHLAILALATSAMVIFGYNQIVKQATPSSAALPTVPRRQLSFQGRLTSSSGTPITTAVDVVFKLWNDPTAGSQLYTSGTCSITPDQNGIFNTLIGNGTCGSEIDSTVFTLNRDVYLEVAVGVETLTPRQQIATVGYALNSETLQGYPASASATINTVPIVDAFGNITIAAASPDIISTSGTFTLSGQALVLQTASNSGGDVVIQPDAIGNGGALVLGNTTSTDTFYVGNALLTSGNLIAGYVGNNTATGRLLSLTTGSPEVDRFYVAINGQTAVNTKATLANAALIIDQNGTGDIFTASSSANTTKFTIGNNGNITATGTLTGLTGLTVNSGTVSLPNGEIGNAEISELDWTKLQNYPGACPAGEALQQVGDTLTCIDIAASSGNLWQRTLGSLAPLEVTNDLNLGDTATASALVHFPGTNNQDAFFNLGTGKVGIGTTAPTAVLDVAGAASVSGSLSFRTGTGTIQTTAFNPLVIGGNTTGNITLNPLNAVSGGYVAPNTTNVTNLGTASLLWKAIYGTTLYQGANQVCDASGNCVAATDLWSIESGALFPKNATVDVLFGGNATASAKFAFTGINTGGTPTASISGTVANVSTFIDGNGNISTTNRQNLVLGNSATYNTTGNILLNPNGTGNVGIGTTAPTAVLDVAGAASVSGSLSFRTGTGTIQTTAFNPLVIGGNTTGNITLNPLNAVSGGYVAPNTTNVTNLGTASLLWKAIYGTTLYQGANQVCDASGNCVAATDLWSIESGALFPKNATVDVLFGGNATASAKFAFTGINTGGTPTASISGTVANVSTFIDGNGNISTTNRQNLVLGNSATYNTTGNILLNPNGTGNVGIGTTNPISMLSVGASSQFQVNSTGNIVLLNNVITSFPSVQGVVGSLMTNDGSGVLSWALPSGTGISGYWTRTGTYLYNTNQGDNVGIGTVSPVAKLDLVGSQNFTAFTAPTALTAGTPTTGGSCTAGTHSYVVTFTSVGAGETTAGTASSIITCVLTTGQTVPLSTIPTGPAGTISRKIYRTVAGNTGSYLLLTTIADNTTTTFSDTIADASLGAAAPVSNTTAVANLQTGGTTRMVIDNSGNVGIGTTNPISMLSVGASSQFQVNSTGNIVLLNNVITSFPSVQGVVGSLMTNDGSGVLSWALPSGTGISGYWTRTGTYLYNTNQGDNVGIGTTGPGQKLEVNGQIRSFPSGGTYGAYFGNDNVSAYVGYNTYVIPGTGWKQDNTAGASALLYQDASGFNFYTRAAAAAEGMGTSKVTITNTGNVGIGVATPTTAKLVVAGNIYPNTGSNNYLGSATYPWLGAYLGSVYNTSGTETIAVTNKYLANGDWYVSTGGLAVNSTAALGTDKFYVSGNAQVSGTLTTGGQVTVGAGAGKIDVGTVDPPYTINGAKYATYMASMVGIKEETVGKVTTTPSDYLEGVGYRTLIDLDQQEIGSDVWLFSQTTDLQSHINDLSVLLTPEGQAKAWYEVDTANKILAIYSSTPTNITYRLTAPRFDSYKWTNTRNSSSTSIGHVLNDPNVYTNIDSIFANPVISPELIAKLDGSYSLKINGQDNFEVSSFLSSLVGNLKAGVAVVTSLVADNLTVRTKLISPLADIDKLNAIDATISGTLYADNIKGQTVDVLHSEIDLLNEKYSTASGILADLQAKYGTYDSLFGKVDEATISGDPLALSPLATTSALIPSDLALNSLNVHTLIANDLMANGSIFGHSISSFDTDLYIQPTGDKSIHLLANLMTLYPDGKVLVNGDLLITGTIYSQGLDTETATVSGTLAVGSSTIASDSARFAMLTTDGLVIASGNNTASGSGTMETNTNATIGTATITVGTTELSILSTKVTPKTLIYITPTSDTNGRVLFVKSKTEGVGFTVGITGDTNSPETSFNYWLVETR